MVRIIMKGIGDRVPITHETVQNAGHFAFMSPFPAEMSRPDFPPAQDPPGFDRAAYQPILQAKIENSYARIFFVTETCRCRSRRSTSGPSVIAPATE